ncbi:MAG: HD domain-containing protein [Candidatus Micrarchaeia archaeon]|jgi:putative hydrolase of HD superfamily
MASNGKTISLLFESMLMKRLPRTGWLHVGAPEESIGAHSFGVALTSLALARMEKLSEEEEHALLRRALLHDLHELRVGDLNAVTRKYTKSDSVRAERDLFSGTLLAPELALLQSERLHTLSRDADKLDLLLMAIMNANAGNKGMAPFIKSALSEIKSKSGTKLARLALAKLKK